MRDGYNTEHKLHMLFRYMFILNSSMHMVDDNAGNQNCGFGCQRCVRLDIAYTDIYHKFQVN